MSCDHNWVKVDKVRSCRICNGNGSYQTPDRTDERFYQLHGRYPMITVTCDSCHEGDVVVGHYYRCKRCGATDD